MKKRKEESSYMKVLQRKYKKGEDIDVLIKEFLKANKKMEKEFKQGIKLIFR